MRQILVCLLIAGANYLLLGQELTLPRDFRQHSLTQFNSNLLNATYALDWNNPNSLAVWSRWQWQTIDGDPTTLFANYTHQLNSNSAFAIGFLQHNTGTFLDTGANLGYVYAFEFEGGVRFFAGLNLAAAQQKLADDRFTPDPDIQLPELEISDSFLIQFSPAFRLQVNRFNVGLAFENAVVLNLSDSERSNSNSFKTVIGTLSNDIPISIFSNGSSEFIRPIVYVKSIPDGDTQFGLNGLFSTSWFWLQGGYNNFYGPSGGVGVTIADRFSLGGLMEFGTDTTLEDEEPSIEILAAFRFGRTDNRKKVVGFDVQDEIEDEERLRLEAEQQKQQELAEAEAAKQQEIERQRMLEKAQKEKDSLSRVQLELEQLREQQRKDSIAALQRGEVEIEKNERYEEIKTEDGLEPGFYLITNVFGTKKYYEKFMQTLRAKGLEPKSFYRSINKYNYVYLERYNSIQEARKARDSKFFGKYEDTIWIFRVRGD
jgi:type IX secretion system PorP/SprF family membrane protein